MILKCFAALREQLNCEEEYFELPEDIKTVAELIQLLQQRSSIWKKAFDDEQMILIAVNQNSANLDTKIHKQDEVAFFPPVTGG